MFKVLIVEDDNNIADIIKDNLEKWGYAAKTIVSFNKVLEEFSEFSPHLVLMDVTLPCYDGFYWCNKIRAVSKVPVIFLSSRSSNMDVIMAVNNGGDDYITKPFSMEVLLAKISAIMRRAYSYVEVNLDTLEYKGAILSLKNNTLLYNKKDVILTRNEFKILHLLMKNNNTIVSRETIMQELWQDENFIDDNTLTVNVNRLRKKLTEIGLVDLIKTVVNQGYIVK